MIITFVGDGFCQNICLRGEPRRCHCCSYARSQVSLIAVIRFNVSFLSCWNRSKLIRHVPYRVHCCISPKACGAQFAQSLRISKSFRKMRNTVDAEIPEYANNSATFQRLSSVKQCSITATCTSVWQTLDIHCEAGQQLLRVHV